MKILGMTWGSSTVATSGRACRTVWSSFPPRSPTPGSHRAPGHPTSPPCHRPMGATERGWRGAAGYALQPFMCFALPLGVGLMKCAGFWSETAQLHCLPEAIFVRVASLGGGLGGGGQGSPQRLLPACRTAQRLCADFGTSVKSSERGLVITLAED